MFPRRRDALQLATSAARGQIISARDGLAFGAKKFTIPFDAAGKDWVRYRPETLPPMAHLRSQSVSPEHLRRLAEIDRTDGGRNP
jgi:hypothetical protein